MALKRLVESFSKDWNEEDIKIEKLKLTESNNKVMVEGIEKNVSGGYLVPIWRLDKKNLNERTYTKRLAEKIIKENKVTLALANHPKDEGSVKDIVAVGKNPTIKNGVMFAECYFVDEDFEKMVEKILALDGKLGLSSSGLGEVDSSGNVVEENFILERYFDVLVSDPSYEVYITKENEMTESIENSEELENIEEQKDLNDSQLDGNNKENVEESVQNQENKKLNIDKVYKNMKNLTLEQKNFVISMTRFIREAKEIEEIEEKIDRFNQLLEWCEDGEFVIPIKEEITETLESLQKDYDGLAKKGKQTDNLVEEVSKLNDCLKEKEEEYNKIKELNDGLYEKFDELKDVTNSMKESYEKSLADKEELEKSLENYIEKEKFNQVVEYSSKLESALKLVRESEKNLIEETESLKKVIQEQKDREAKEQSDFEEMIKDRKRKTEEALAKEAEEKRLKEEEEKSKTSQFDRFKYEVVDLYNDWEKENPKIKEYKDMFMECRNVREAQSLKLKLKEKLDDYSEYFDDFITNGQYKKIEEKYVGTRKKDDAWEPKGGWGF